jgi:hypothetical protein
MITEKTMESDRASKAARLNADNARLRKLAAEIEADVRELRVAVGMKRGRPAIDPAHRLLVVSGGERRARGAWGILFRDAPEEVAPRLTT